MCSFRKSGRVANFNQNGFWPKIVLVVNIIFSQNSKNVSFNNFKKQIWTDNLENEIYGFVQSRWRRKMKRVKQKDKTIPMLWIQGPIRIEAWDERQTREKCNKDEETNWNVHYSIIKSSTNGFNGYAKNWYWHYSI